MSRILLGVSGGVAAYKTLEFIRLATGEGHSVRVVQTPNSKRFVGEASFAALTGAPVLASEFERDPARGAFPDQKPPTHDPVSHLQLVANADLFLIAPASANTIAKLAAGMADNLLCGCALAAACPVVLAPAMNNHMYEHPATQANLARLAERGVRIVAPGVGRLASKGEHGVGRLAEPSELLRICGEQLAGPDATQAPAQDLQGLNVLVSAGGTREPIDSVRFIANASSGRMGFALAEAAQRRGANVTLVAANVALDTPAGVRRVDVSSAAQLKDACEREFPACELLLMSAAVADFTPADPAEGKLKKGDRERLELVLEPTADVLLGLASQRRAGQTLIGFAAEHGPQAIEHARGKLTAKSLDAIVVNDISRSDIGFDVDANEVTVLSKGSDGRQIAELHIPRASKSEVAHEILSAAVRIRSSG